MGLFSSFINGTLQEDIVNAVDTLERFADVAVDKLEHASGAVEKGTEKVEHSVEKTTRVIDTVKDKLPGDKTD